MVTAADGGRETNTDKNEPGRAPEDGRTDGLTGGWGQTGGDRCCRSDGSVVSDAADAADFV